MTVLTVNDVTQATLDGSGVFDVLMRANKAHLESEFKQNRIKGSEYATVYLGSLVQVMQTALQFVMSKDKLNLESQLLEQQILLATAEVTKAAATLAQVEAQTALLVQQKANLALDAINTPKQGELLSAQKLQIDAQTLLVQQQKLNLLDDLLTNTKQRTKLDNEITLLAQKTITERAQVNPVDTVAGSVIHKQNALYQAQTDGYARDAELKAADLMVKTWNVRRTTDEGTIAGLVSVGVDNKLGDIDVGRAVTKLLTGVGA